MTSFFSKLAGVFAGTESPSNETPNHVGANNAPAKVSASATFTLLNTEDTITRLIALIRGAKEKVILVSPYLTLGAEDRVGRAVREALARGVNVMVVIREDAQTPLKQGTLELLNPLFEQGLGCASVPGLHAKVYYSDSAVLVTSLNLLSSSFLNTVEVGLWSDSQETRGTVHQFLQQEVWPLLHVPGTGVPLQKWLDQQAKKVESQPKRTSSTRSARRQQQADQGHCIRCGDGIAFKPARPYCAADYASWKEWENADYKDNFCHGCGEEHPATMRRPLCRDCFQQSEICPF